MLDLKRMPPLAELLALKERFSAEQWLDLELAAPTIVRFQEYPDLALATLSGIVIPPHQRTILYQLHRGAANNVVVASRGTAKSSTVGTLYATYVNIFFARRNAITLSMTGFRGGQQIFKDTERWLEGGWVDQQLEVPFFLASVNRIGRPRPVSKAATQWELEFLSKSSNKTLPTKDPENILGNRAHDLYVDEAKLLDKFIIDNVATPFLNVKGDFRHGGRFAESNRIFYTSTVDYNWRPFQERCEAARNGVLRDMRALEAARLGKWELYHKLATQGLCKYTYTQIDYTDLLVPQIVTNRDGKRFEVAWPNPDIEVTHDPAGVPFWDWDPVHGKMDREGHALSYFQTYPLDKETLERGLRDGSADEAGWKSEQRNIVDTALGDVYPNRLVDEACCAGDRVIIPFKKLPQGWQDKFADEQLGYVPPILHECTDPCVMGVDFAPQNDFCAFVVIRIGPCAEGDFDPFTGCGKTTWSNVIWAEQHQKMTAKEVADKIREYKTRYNLTAHYDPFVEDPWLLCRAIGLDLRGGGTAVRDELCYLNDEEPPKDAAPRIYDPTDLDDRIQAFAKDPRALPWLDGFWPTAQVNDVLVTYTIAQMEQSQLYLPKWLEESERLTTKGDVAIAYNASKALEKQLRKLRQMPLQNWRKFYMDGDTKQFINKKDLWAAFIYASRQLRAHQIRQRQIEDTPPPLGGRVTRVASKRGKHSGRAPGARS